MMTRQDVRTLADALVGPHFGLVEAVEFVAPEADDPPLHVCAGRLCNTRAFAAVEVPVECSGAALDPDAALGACLGEAVERYAAGVAPAGETAFARAGELPGRVVPPSEFALFSPEQGTHRSREFPFVPWNLDDPIGWIEAQSLTHGGRAWVPATFIREPYTPPGPEAPFAPCITTGLACAASREEAVVAGLCEVVERDAVALAWLGCVIPSCIARSGMRAVLSGEALRVAGMLDERAFRWALFDLATDAGVPVFAALIEGNSPVGLVVSFGSACRVDPARAAAKALVEAAHGRLYVKSLRRMRPEWKPGRRFENVRSFADHALWATADSKRGCESLEPWWNSPTRADTAHDSLTSLDSLVRRLASLGHAVLVADLTTPDVAPLGLHVVRVVVPGMQPLHGNHHWPHLAGKRLRRLPGVFGRHVALPRRWNPLPHPCP